MIGSGNYSLTEERIKAVNTVEIGLIDWPGQWLVPL